MTTDFLTVTSRLRLTVCFLLLCAAARSQPPFTVELNGERVDVTSLGSCMSPVTRNGIVQIDCSLTDGPVYYFDESTRANLSICPSWGCDTLLDESLRRICETQCPPREWPMAIEGCSAGTPDSLSGSWRLESVASPRGFVSTTSGWTMTITDDLLVFDLDESVAIERAYSVIERNGQRFQLDLQDASGETESIGVELAPCGLLVEAGSTCGVFCRNIYDEVGLENIRAIVSKLLPSYLGDDAVDQALRSYTSPVRRGPFFPRRSYFRQIAPD